MPFLSTSLIGNGISGLIDIDESGGISSQIIGCIGSQVDGLTFGDVSLELNSNLSLWKSLCTSSFPIEFILKLSVCFVFGIYNYIYYKYPAALTENGSVVAGIGTGSGISFFTGNVVGTTSITDLATHISDIILFFAAFAFGLVALLGDVFAVDLVYRSSAVSAFIGGVGIAVIVRAVDTLLVDFVNCSGSCR